MDGVDSYNNKLKQLYMYEEDFRSSVEISVVFQICLIIATLEDTYKINMLRDHFEKEQPQEKKENIFFDDNNDDDNNGNEIEDFYYSKFEEKLPEKVKSKDNNLNLNIYKSNKFIDNIDPISLAE